MNAPLIPKIFGNWSGRGAFVFAAFLTTILSSGGCMKVVLDDEVRRLCAVDGGIKVYETVTLPAEKFDEFGVLPIPSKKDAKPDDEYYYEWDTTDFKKGNPEMRRYHSRLVRKTDGKILGEAVTYSRVGGDPPGPWHESSFQCPENADISDLEKIVFKKIDKGERP